MTLLPSAMHGCPTEQQDSALQALPIFLDRLVDPITAVALSVTVVLLFGRQSCDAAQQLCCKVQLC